jgi:alpha-galactosidase
MNRSISEVWSSQAKASEMGTVFHKYILGLYKVLDTLVYHHPDVLFEGCSGGGGRFDAGMLYYHPQIWCSDNTDAVNRLKIQYGTSFGYPVSAMGAHVSVCPNHQTGRSVPLTTRGTVAMSGTFGYELDPGKMTDEEKAVCREMTEKFKNYQNLIFNGDYYRMESPYGQKGFTAWSFVSKDKRESNDAQRYLKFRGLDPHALYRMDGFEKCWSGRALMHAGVPLSISKGEYESGQYHLTVVDK